MSSPIATKGSVPSEYQNGIEELVSKQNRCGRLIIIVPKIEVECQLVRSIMSCRKCSTTNKGQAVDIAYWASDCLANIEPISASLLAMLLDVNFLIFQQDLALRSVTLDLDKYLA